VNVRTLTDADAETVATVVVPDSEALTGRPSLLGPRDVREWWSRVDLSRDSWVFEEDDDQSLWFVVRDRAWRGRGLAKALLRRTFCEFWRRGVIHVSLDVDADSPTGATKLYERVGKHVESAMIVYER